MNKKVVNISARLYEDEAICFIADRYHTSPQEVVQCFLVQDGIVPEQDSSTTITFRLENNEVEILRGLMKSKQS